MSNMNPLVLIEEIYNEHYVYLRNFLIGLTKSDVIADDIIQDFFTKILVSPSVVTEVTYIRSWLITGVKNTMLDYYKKSATSCFTMRILLKHCWLIVIHRN